MNKKQLIVAWIMGILICISSYHSYYRPHVLSIWYAETGKEPKSYISVNQLILRTIPILIIGSLLIYSLRDKKK
jgi:hypothetical protein